MTWWTGIKTFLVGAASLVLLGSDALGINHPTVAKTIASLVIATLGAETYAENKRAALDVRKAALKNGVDPS